MLDDKKCFREKNPAEQKRGIRSSGLCVREREGERKGIEMKSRREGITCASWLLMEIDLNRNKKL